MPENGNRFSFGVPAAMLVCAAAFLGIGAPAASAAPEAGPGFVSKGSFGEFFPLLSETPRTPVALDSNGNVFAGDQLFEEVHVFKPDEASGGESLTQFSVGGSPRNLAIDQSTDALYIDQAGGSVVKRWTSDGSPTPTYTLDPTFEVPQGDGIAVDPTSGDLLVADPGAEGVRRYDSSGTLTATISTASINPSWLLVLPDGSFYVATASGPDLTHFSGTGTLLGTIAGVGSLHGLSYDPGRSVIVASVGSKLVTYSTAGDRLAESGASGGSGIGTAVSPSSRLYEHTASLINFYAPAIVPGVEPPTVSDLTASGFHVETEVDPGEKEGGGVPDGSVVRFEYRLVGDSSWTPTPDQPVTAPGSYGTDIAVEPNRDYEVRAVASNDDISNTSDAVSVTSPVAPPATVTQPPTDLTETSATISGTINPFGLLTTYYFEYGATTAYGSKLPVSIEAPAGKGTVARVFSRELTGLTPGGTYHFRLIATSSAGRTEGVDRSFTTLSSGASPVRAYEQVTPADKEGATIIPNLSFLVAPDGHGFSYTTKGNSQNAPLEPRSLVLRGADDWGAPIAADLPTNQMLRGFFETTNQAVSDDFTKTFNVTNRALTPGATEGGANLYLVDVASGSRRFIASNSSPLAFLHFAAGQAKGKFLAGAPDFSWFLFWSPDPMEPGAPNYAIYRWSEDDGLEIVSVLANGEPSEAAVSGEGVVYEPASADGTKIYYSALGGSEEGVFLREQGKPPVPLAVRPHIDPGPSTPEPPTLLGTSRDGRYAFIGSAEPLTADAPPSGPAAGLYRYDRAEDKFEYLGARIFVEYLNQRRIIRGPLGIAGDGKTIYFGSVDEEGVHPVSVWHNGVFEKVGQNPNREGLRMSTDGRYLVYNEGGSLFRYDADLGTSSCVSCTQDGAPVPFDPSLLRDVDDQGTVYFDSLAPLLSSDVNGAYDVYAFRDGQLSLISPGDAPFPALFAGISEGGRDVFFTTSQKLVGRDNDESVDVYDARVNGGFPAQNPVPGPACRVACGAVPPSPPAGVGGSETLSGSGNVKAHAKKATCGKGKRRQKVKGKSKCVKKKSKKHKASTKKRGGSR
jgi:hypothetical protein